MSFKAHSILSAGIDIGTSTTKLIISKLVLQNTSSINHFPRIEIIDKTIEYKSPIFRTPLIDEFTINVKEVEKIVFEQYQQANIEPQDVKAGAILITGETATKKNASELIHHLSDAAGEFLVATAGPDLESILAAKGSGAVTYSKKLSKVIANIDIGGGTANIAVLKNGEIIGTATLHLGGRLMEYENNRLISIAPAIKKFLTKNRMSINIQDLKDITIEKFVIDNMLNSLNAVLYSEQNEECIPMLLGHLPNWSEKVECIMFSGGVAQFIYPELKHSEKSQKFDDIGKKIAEALVLNKQLQQFDWLEPLETVRATVIGAGTHSMEVSGSSIEVKESLLPLKNIPVHTCDFHHSLTNIKNKIIDSILKSEQLYQIEEEAINYALYLKNIPYLNFKDVRIIAECILENWTKSNTIILILESDYAKVLGQTLIQNGKKNIVCIDQITVDTGDYIDIGNPIDSGVVPVVVKTLIFHKD